MSKSDERPQRAESEPKRVIPADSGFVPQPVAPDEARRRDPSAELHGARDVVELTSPIGHRLRVPPSEPGEKGTTPAAPETARERADTD